MFLIKRALKIIFMLFLFVVFSDMVHAQIIVNGRNPSKYNRGLSGPKNAVSISYGNIIWADGKNVPLSGYSLPLEVYHAGTSPLSAEKYNYSFCLYAGYERQMADYFGLRLAFTSAHLITGMMGRSDLMAYNDSKISQLGIYGRYALTKNSNRIQLSWLAGPELIFAKKDILIQQYVNNENSTPADYRQDISVTEGAVVTGLGVSFRISTNFSFFGDFMAGVSLPGGGIKATNSGMGLKVGW